MRVCRTELSQRRVVDILCERGELNCGSVLPHLIGVHEEEIPLILDEGFRVLEGEVAIVREVYPLALSQRPRKIAKILLNKLLSTISRSGVMNQPMCDERANRGQAMKDHVPLVTHDHVQADDGHF